MDLEFTVLRGAGKVDGQRDRLPDARGAKERRLQKDGGCCAAKRAHHVRVRRTRLRQEVTVAVRGQLNRTVKGMNDHRRGQCERPVSGSAARSVVSCGR